MTAITSPGGRIGGTVLVVDDDRMNRIMLAKLLETEGYEAKTVVGGREALAAIASEPFDAVLLDILMPEVDGFAVLQQIKYDSRLWHIPVIMISAVEERDSIVRCLEIGADDYVVKPFDPVVLQARIKACLARRRFRDLEVEYQKVVAEQLTELEDLNRSAVIGPLRRFLPERAAARVLDSGAPLLPAPHRRDVAVLTCELTGFATLAGTAEPADTVAVLNDFYRVAGEMAARFEATVAASGGGAITVLFNDPFPCPDPGAAVLGMAEALGPRLTARLAERPTLGWGVGISLGSAVVGHAGFGGRWDYEAVGPVIERAARLRRAPGGGIVVDGDTRSAVDHLVIAEAIPGWGEEESGATFRVVGFTPAFTSLGGPA